MTVSSKQKPLLLLTAQPAEGHTGPLLQIAAYLVKKGYQIVFISSREFEPKITALGGEFVETPAIFANTSPDDLARMAKIAPGPEKAVAQQEVVFFEPMVRRTQIVGDTLERLREREGPRRQIIVVNEIVSMSVYAFKRGRPPPRGFAEFPRTVGINIIPLYLQSVDVAPFLLGLPPDASEAGRARNAALYRQMLDGPMKPLAAIQDKCLAEAGATVMTDPDTMPYDVWMTSMDVVLQMCSPELEYPRSDLPGHIKFAGCLPLKSIPKDYVYPEWWAEITANHGQKKIVFVSQGTVQMELDELVIPTLQALDGREDLIVVAALGKRGASLPETVKIPTNARVQDYLLYDAILEYADVFVTNGGYGGIVHAVVNGVPLVSAGETEDKVETSMRAERAGIAVNLGTQSPSPAQVRSGVLTVLSNPEFKRRAMEIKHANEQMDCLTRIERQIEEFTL